MGKRTWLNTQLATEYFPAIAALSDTESGRTAAADLAAKLRQSWVDRGFQELNQLRPIFDDARRQIRAKFGEHFALNYIGLTTAEYIEINNQNQDTVAARNEDVKQLENPDAIVAKAVELLDSMKWWDVAAGLAVLTGRRAGEMIATAQFVKETQWSVIFTGALKRRGELVTLSFEIPTLKNADRIIAALAKIRRELPQYTTQTSAKEVSETDRQRVRNAVNQHFTGLVPPREGDDLYTHLTRCVYAVIATFWYCPAWVDPNEFKAAIQGHYAILEAENPVKRRSLAAGRHYSDYEIADSVIAHYNGKRKGIKLGWGGIEPIACFQRSDQARPADAINLASDPPSPTPKSEPMLKEAAPHSHRKRTPRKSVWINYQDEDLVQKALSHFGATDTTEDRIAAMSRWVRWSLEKLETEAHPAADASEQGEQQAIVAPPDTPDQTPTQATTPGVAPKTKANSEVDELKAMFAQTLGMFQTFLQAQSLPPTTRTGDNGLATPATRATDQDDRTSLGDRPLKTDSASDTSKKTRSPRSKSPEKTTKNAELTQQILAAINDTQRYNRHIDQTQQPHKLKREITANFLKALTPNQRLINRILDQQQVTIDQHHQQLHIQPGHNSSYREKITLADVQQSLRSGAIDSQA